jgi:hypothetical protein
MRSAAVKRIDDVIALRARQFREDAGPLAHPVRPESYIEINNFYTATVYEKGAELIGMLRRLVGAAGYAPRSTSISNAMTGRPARSRTGSGCSRMPPAAIWVRSAAGTRRRARRMSMSPNGSRMANTG